MAEKTDARAEASHPMRRKMTAANWAIKGELFLNCSCTVFCPCVVSLGAHPPTEGHCHAWMAIAIDEGHFEGEDLSGLNIGLLVDIPGRMAKAIGASRLMLMSGPQMRPITGFCRFSLVQLAGQRGFLPSLFPRSLAPSVKRSRFCVKARSGRS